MSANMHALQYYTYLHIIWVVHSTCILCTIRILTRQPKENISVQCIIAKITFLFGVDRWKSFRWHKIIGARSYSCFANISFFIIFSKSAIFALKDHVSSTLLGVRSKWYMPREWMYLCNTQTDSYSTELHRYTTHKTQRLGQLTKPQFNKSLPCT